MSVCEIAEDTLVEPDHVYIEPRGHDVAIREGMLSREPALRGPSHLPIDLFFRALALDQGSHAAGIVFSGTGTDGTLGLGAIRAASGLALVQDPATAEFDGMPVSAIEAFASDFVLPPAEMPARLLVHRKALVSPSRADGAPELSPNDIQSMLAVIRKRGGLDFSEYKQGTLGRRIARRMQLHGIHDPREYARYLDQSDAEIDILWHDWLIDVSSFFRDPEVFLALESALSELISEREDGSPMRVWVPGCATGEEAYSLVILVTETLRRLKKSLEVQVFATDLNPAAIQVARTGRYLEDIAADVGDSRLARFFTREDGSYRVKRELRDVQVAERSVPLHLDQGPQTVHLKVSPLHAPRLAAPLFLVSFESAEGNPRRRRRRRKSAPIAAGGEARHGAMLERELRHARNDLQGTIDELQTANEELASANEETQSANEELQSTNEELQTAKEETQSLNEELHTVNAELSQKLQVLEEATNDLINLMNNIEVATIFLDQQLRVKRFTPQARHVAHLIDADIGRPLADLTTHLDYPDLLADAADVIETLQASEKQAPAPDGGWYLVRIRPYRTARNVVEGVVVTFIDITGTRHSERIEAARQLAERIVDAVREPFLVLDGELRVVRANRAYYQFFQVESKQTEGHLIADLGSHQWIIPTLRERLEKALQEDTGFDDFEVEAEFPNLGRRRLLLNARPLSPKDGTGAELVLLGIQDVGGPQAAATREALDP